MKNLIHPLICLALLFTHVARAEELPFFGSLRAQIVSQLTIASNNLPLDKKLVTGLGANLKLIDKTKPNLISGTAALGTLAKGLGRTSLSNTFLPIVVSTRADYLDFIETEKGLLEERLADTVPGKARTAAGTSLDKLSAAIEAANTNANLTGSLKSLSKAATALGTAQKSVIKAETAKPGADFLLATITESNQGATTFKPTQKTILDATYDPFSGEIDIDGGEMKSLGGGRVQVRFLSLAAIVPGEGTHTLSLTNANDGYAIYERGIVLNINAPYPEVESQETYLTVDPVNHRLGTGTMTITLDLDANLVWGEFTFTAKGMEDSNLAVSMTGSFLVRLEVFE
jgi:hypothetical protein